MEINVNKTNVIRLTTSASPMLCNYTLNNRPSVGTIKYLSVHLSSDLSWNTHVDMIVSKTSKILGFVWCNLHLANSTTKHLTYIVDRL